MTDPVRRSAARLATLVALPVALVVGLLSVWLLGGLDRSTSAPTPAASPRATASGPVPVSAPPLTPGTAEVCRAVVAGLPATVPGGARRPVSAGPEQNAAYGDPPTTLACGTAPATFAPTAGLTLLSGVCWYAGTGGSRTVWTTVDRVVPVTVTVPGPAAGSAQSVIPFSDAIAAADVRRPDAPSGCS